MKGTIIKNLKLTKVIDGDTIKLMLDEKEESIRFACLDTEESHVYKSGTKENSNLRIAQEDWSPYFIKYGRSRLYHVQLMEAESRA